MVQTPKDFCGAALASRGVADERRPVLVGVGQVRGNRERTVYGAPEPIHLLLDAVAAAVADSRPGPGWSGWRRVIDVVKVVSWAYDDLAGRLAAPRGARPAYTLDSRVGGYWAALLLESSPKTRPPHGDDERPAPRRANSGCGRTHPTRCSPGHWPVERATS